MKHQQCLGVMALVGAALCSLTGCESAAQKAATLERQAMQQAKEAAASKETQTARSLLTSIQATRLLPADDSNWDLRIDAQDHIATLQDQKVWALVEVKDVVRINGKLVASGVPLSFWVDFPVWIRLRNVDEAQLPELKKDYTLCVGDAWEFVPLAPYATVNVLNEDEFEMEMDAIPLIIELECEAVFGLEYESADAIEDSP